MPFFFLSFLVSLWDGRSRSNVQKPAVVNGHTIKAYLESTLPSILAKSFHVLHLIAVATNRTDEHPFPNAVRKGWLTMKSSRGFGRRKRWCMLYQGNYLFYFRRVGVSAACFASCVTRFLSLQGACGFESVCVRAALVFAVICSLASLSVCMCATIVWR